MNSHLSQIQADDHIDELHRDARNGAPGGSGVAIRIATTADGQALRRLADLEGTDLPAGGMLVAELDGRLLAALSLDGAVALADPFRPTASLVELLRMRLDHLTGGREPGLRGRLRGALRTAGWTLRGESAARPGARGGPAGAGRLMIR